MSNHGGDRTGSLAATEFSSAQRVDEILTALAHVQRRRILHYLDDDSPASRGEVARQVAAWERETTPTTVSEEAVRVTETELHHTHLPRLQDVRLIEYDRRSERLLSRDLPELVEHCLENCGPTDLPSQSLDGTEASTNDTDSDETVSADAARTANETDAETTGAEIPGFDRAAFDSDSETLSVTEVPTDGTEVTAITETTTLERSELEAELEAVRVEFEAAITDMEAFRTAVEPVFLEVAQADTLVASFAIESERLAQYAAGELSEDEFRDRIAATA